jgi:hypothetical protein
VSLGLAEKELVALGVPAAVSESVGEALGVMLWVALWVRLAVGVEEMLGVWVALLVAWDVAV